MTPQDYRSVVMQCRAQLLALETTLYVATTRVSPLAPANVRKDVLALQGTLSKQARTYANAVDALLVKPSFQNWAPACPCEPAVVGHAAVDVGTSLAAMGLASPTAVPLAGRASPAPVHQPSSPTANRTGKVEPHPARGVANSSLATGDVEIVSNEIPPPDYDGYDADNESLDSYPYSY